MRVWSRRGPTAAVAAAVLMASFGGAVRAQTAGPPDPDTPAPLYTIDGLGPTRGDNVILLRDEELLQAIRANPADTGPAITARALGVAHTSMFDAWAAYDTRAIGTRYGGQLRRSPAERTLENSTRPITGIREHDPGRQVVSWLGPYKGYGLVNGESWIPYQEFRVVTPPLPEYVSGHSIFSAAGVHGRGLGAAVGADAWVKAQTYIRPFNTGPL
jgi:hypothetical protein